MNSEHLAAYVTRHARKNPGKAAITFSGGEVTYAELDRESNRIAANLLKIQVNAKNGATKNVAVILDRSPAIIAVIYGILKAGKVFVPLSVDIPGERMALLLKETKPAVVITATAYYERYKKELDARNSGDLLLLEDINRETEAGELEFEMIYNKYAYIYFTSGSTGIPKGVLGRHKSLHHYIDWQIGEFNVNDTTNVSQLIPPTFDPYLRDVFVPLTAGGTCHIPDFNTLMNPAKLIAWIDESGINLIHMVPSMFKLLSRQIDGPDYFRDLKYILLAGELLRGNDIRDFIEIFGHRVRLVNQYGPTETTLAKFYYHIKPGDIHRSVIPVGKPIKGAEALILDPDRRKCLTGNTGEIYIRTPFISSGYFNKKELNKDVFIRNPFSGDKNDIIYKTGDIGRQLFDGNIELTGRADNQVKLRGNRVELGEIENRLLQCEGIKEAVVLDKDDGNGEKYLCAYMVPENGRIEIDRVKSMLARQLPAYMVPTYFVPLDAMPLNPNGKIDRKTLKQKEPDVNETDREYSPPKSEMERKIAALWMEELKREQVSINDSFFDIGGTSLHAIRLNSRINETLEQDIPIVKFFEHPTIEQYVQYINDTGNPQQENKRTPQKEKQNNAARMESRIRKRNNAEARKQRLKELRNG